MGGAVAGASRRVLGPMLRIQRWARPVWNSVARAAGSRAAALHTCFGLVCGRAAWPSSFVHEQFVGLRLDFGLNSFGSMVVYSVKGVPWGLSKIFVHVSLVESARKQQVQHMLCYVMLKCSWFG